MAAGGAARWVGDRVDIVGSSEDQRRRRGDRVVATIDALVDQLAQMRGAAMKAGQVLSTVEFPGLDPDQAEYLRGRLASLRDDVPPVSWPKMQRVLRDEWGEDPAQVVASIGEEPAAAASIGQVYRATLHSGREVAVKVQYPGIAEAVESDMRNIRLLTPLLRKLMPGLDIRAVLDELTERIVDECDYELEASNHRRLARFWRDHPFIRVPDVDTGLSRRRVLVSDWIDGIGFEQVTQQDDGVRDRYAEVVYRFFYSTAHELGLALGDPHPGNYMLCPDGRVAFFDFGMLSRLPPAYLRDEAVVLAAIRGNDSQRLLDAMRGFGYLPGPREDWDAGLLLIHMRAVGWWLVGDEPVRLTPEDVWRSTEPLSGPQRDEVMGIVRRMTVPPEALLLRRMEGLLFQIASNLRAEADWAALFGELVAGDPPVGELGREHELWLNSRH